MRGERPPGRVRGAPDGPGARLNLVISHRQKHTKSATINNATCCCCLLLYNEIFVGHESTGPWTPAGARRSRRAQERAGQGEREPTPAPTRTTRLHLLPHTATTPTAPAARTHRCWTRGGAPFPFPRRARACAHGPRGVRRIAGRRFASSAPKSLQLLLVGVHLRRLFPTHHTLVLGPDAIAVRRSHLSAIEPTSTSYPCVHTISTISRAPEGAHSRTPALASGADTDPSFVAATKQRPAGAWES